MTKKKYSHESDQDWADPLLTKTAVKVLRKHSVIE